MTSPAEFHAERRKGIGGTDASAIIGKNPYRQAIDVYKEKIGETEPEPDTKQTLRGKHLEPVARNIFSELTKYQVVHGVGLMLNPRLPWALAHIDGIVQEEPDTAGGVLEIKCPSIWTFAKIKREGLPESWIIQMQHYLAVTDFAFGIYAIFNADLWEMIHFRVGRDDVFIRGLMKAEKEFWENHVEKRLPPSSIAIDFKVELPETEKGELVLRNDPDWNDAAARYVEALNIRAQAEELVEAGKLSLKQLMEKHGVTEGGGIRCYWRGMPGKRTFDKDAVKKAKPLDRLEVFSQIADFANDGNITMEKATALSDILADCELDLEQYYKVGKPFEEFRSYPVAVPKPVED